MSVLEVIEEGVVTVSVINNPIDPRDVTNFSVPVHGRVLISELVGQPYSDVVFSINGDIVSDQAYAGAYVSPGDYVVICPILTGGGRKNMLRIVAMIGLAAVSGGVAAGAIGGLSGATALVAGAAVSVVGGILINAVLPIKPVIPDVEDTFSDAPSYSAETGNPTDQSTPVPIVYGTALVKPVRVGIKTENIDQNTQDVYMLFAMSEGVVDAIEPDTAPPSMPNESDGVGSVDGVTQNATADPKNAFKIFIDDQPLRNFNSSEVYFSYTKGEQDQAGPEFFDEESKTQTARAVGLDFGAWQTFTTTSPIDRFEVEVACPQGLGYTLIYNNKDHSFDMRVDFDVEYKRPSDTWDGPNVRRLYDDSIVVGAGLNVWKAYYSDGEILAEIRAGDRIANTKVDSRGRPTQVFFSSIAAMRAAGYRSGSIETLENDLGIPGRREKWVSVGSVKEEYDSIPDLPHITDKSTNPVRKSFKSPQLDHAVYDVRIRKRGASSPMMNEVWRWHTRPYHDKEDLANGAPEGFFYKPTITKPYAEPSEYPIKEGSNGQAFYDSISGRYDGFRILDARHVVQWAGNSQNIVTPFSYPNTALLSLRMRLTDRLNTIPTISVVLRGRKVKVFTRDEQTGAYSYHTEVSSNPAWISWDMLTHPDLGGISESRLDLDKWYSWAKFCESASLEFNGVFQTVGNLWDAAQFVFRAGHAQQVNLGTRFSLAIEREDHPVMMFNVGNIVEKSLRVEWLPREERINEVEVTFYDRDDNYKESTVVVRDPNADGDPRQRVHRLAGYWITDAEQATREAIFELNTNRLINKVVSFRAPVEAIACTVGDQILLQHDMPKWGQGGRLAPGSTSSVLKLDRPVTMSAGKSYKVLLQFDSVSQYAGVIAQRPGNSSPTYTGSTIYLQGFDGQKSIKRLITGGVEYGVTEVVQSAGVYGVRVRQPILVAPGSGYELKDTDTIIEADVVLVEGDHDQVTLTSALSAAPPTLTKWMFGAVDKVKMPYRIKAIAGTADVRTIKALDYNAGVFNMDEVVIEPPVIRSPAIGHIRNVQFENRQNLLDAVYRPDIYFSWDRPVEGVYGGVDVYVASNSIKYKLLAQVRNGLQSYTYSGGVPGDRLRFKFIAVDIFGVAAPPLYAPLVDVDVQADQIAPEPPTDIEAKPQLRAVELTWTKASASDLKSTRISRSSTSNYEDAVGLADVDSESYIDYPPSGAVYHYFLSSVDFSGNEGDKVSVSCAYRQLESGDIGDEAIFDYSLLANVPPQYASLLMPAKGDVWQLTDNATTTRAVYPTIQAAQRREDVLSVFGDACYEMGSGGTPGRLVYADFGTRYTYSKFSTLGWVRFKPGSSGNQTLISQQGLFDFRRKGGSAMELILGLSGGQVSFTNSGLHVGDGEWVLVGFSVNAPAQRVRIFVGELMVEFAGDCSIIGVPGRVTLGNNESSLANSVLDGYARSVAFFGETELSAARVKDIVGLKQPFIDAARRIIAPPPSAVSLAFV